MPVMKLVDDGNRKDGLKLRNIGGDDGLDLICSLRIQNRHFRVRT